MAEKHLLPLPPLCPARQVDITGDGGVLKEVLEPGAGVLVPQPDDDVCVHYVRWLSEDGIELGRCPALACRACMLVRVVLCARDHHCTCCLRWGAVVLLSQCTTDPVWMGQVTRSP